MNSALLAHLVLTTLSYSQKQSSLRVVPELLVHPNLAVAESRSVTITAISMGTTFGEQRIGS